MRQRDEAALRKHLREHDQKAALEKAIRKKIEIRLELAKTRRGLEFDLPPTAIKRF